MVITVESQSLVRLRRQQVVYFPTTK